MRPGRAEIAVASDDAVTFFDIESGERISSVQFPETIETIAWHPSGREYAVAATNGTIHLVSGQNVVSGQNCKTVSLDGHRGGAPRLAFNHAGDLLVSCGADRMMRFWEGHTGRLLFTTPSTMTNPVFSRDDLYLGPEIDDTRVSFWEVASGHEYRTFTAQWGTSKPPMLHDGAVSPESQWLAVATDSGVTIWDFQTGEEMATLPCGETIGCLFMRNGSLLTSGAKGVFEWPIQGADGLWQIGPPKQ
jgi:WD40 repeat protein